MPHIRVAIGATLLALALVGALVYAGVRTEPPPRTLGGKVTIVGTAHFRWEPGTCTGAGPFTDLTEGASVLVRDLDGTTLLTTRLGAGMPEKITRDSTRQTAAHCTFLLPTEAVPSRPAYRIQIGRRPPSQVEGPAIAHLTLRFGA